MRKNFGVKPWTYPQPVFILAAYDEHGVPNAMNAAWGGISEENEFPSASAQSTRPQRTFWPAKPSPSAWQMPPMSRPATMWALCRATMCRIKWPGKLPHLESCLCGRTAD